MRRVTDSGRGLWRSRWAAIGAAVAVTVGAGGAIRFAAAASDTSTFVAVTPVRVLDTRTDVGLVGPLVSAVSQDLNGPATPRRPPDLTDSWYRPVATCGGDLNVRAAGLWHGPAATGFVSIPPARRRGHVDHRRRRRHPRHQLLRPERRRLEDRPTAPPPPAPPSPTRWSTPSATIGRHRRSHSAPTASPDRATRTSATTT